ncbi:MAG: DNA (cytosine-5-)-methyltransferase [Endomicrobium sp.]|jgi:DNA (cytosine-5)-methyltransferase 1|nr:DNA (cytosine-5-)-methyltransferase [Endomicrobium sp.]
MKRLKFMDFCAGIGGGRLGLEKAGCECVGYSEIMPASVKTYNILHNAKNEKNFGDLTKINIDELPDFDIMIAGFPCQAFSIMGQRKGFEDERGQIIYHLIKILKAKNIPYFILENVKGLINHDKGKTLETIKTELESAGYYLGYKVLNSVDYGVPQMRERIYFVGIKKDKIKNGKYKWSDKIPTPRIEEYLCDNNSTILDSDDKGLQKYLSNKYNKDRVNLNKILSEDYLVIDTRQSDLREYRGKVPTLRTGRHGILYVKNGKFRRLSGFESLLLQGFDKESAKRASEEMCEVDLLSQAGNAMTASVIETLAKSLVEYIGDKF